MLSADAGGDRIPVKALAFGAGVKRGQRRVPRRCASVA
ncbi:hypothetical protein ACP70R_049080 [Stipagrostis hirtigluma subsp. patula]